MTTILNGNDTNRLVEVLAGSTTLLSNNDVSGASPLNLTALLGNDTGNADTDAANNANVELGSTSLDSATSLLGGTLGNQDGITDGIAGGLAGNALGIGDLLNLGSESSLDLAGPDGAAQPVFDATNVLVKDFHYQLETLSHETGTSDLIHSITNLGETVGLGNVGVVPPAADGHTNLVTDVINLPGTLLNGGLDDVIAQVGGDLGDTLHAVNGVVDAVLNGNDPLNPVPELIDSLGLDLQTLPILNVNGGTSSGDGGLLGGGFLGGGLLSGVAGDLTGSSSGHLVDVDAGPASPHGLGLDLLAAPGTDATHTASVNAVDVGPNGPQLLDLGVLTGAGIISIPGLGGVGSDGLAGGLPGGLLGGLNAGHIGDIASGNSATTPVDVTALTDLVSLTGDHGVLDLHGAHII